MYIMPCEFDICITPLYTGTEYTFIPSAESTRVLFTTMFLAELNASAVMTCFAMDIFVMMTPVSDSSRVYGVEEIVPGMDTLVE